MTNTDRIAVVITIVSIGAIVLVVSVLSREIARDRAEWQAQDLARCRLVLSVKSTRRDSVEYVVAHHCEAALTPEPHR